MFFKDIDKWSKQKLRGLKAIFSFLHFVCLVLIPVIITGVNYKLFETGGTYKLTAIGIIVVVILGLYAYSKLKEVIDELPQVKLGQQRFKFSVQTILSLAPIIIILVALEYAKNDYLIAINVIKWCSVSFASALLIDGLFLKYIKAELSLRNKAIEIVEVEKRKGLV